MAKAERKRHAHERRTRLHFLGAARTVTGSLHFLEISEGDKTIRFFIDAGLNQESSGLNFQNRLPSGLKATDIDFGILSHAHIDHTGYLPKLVKDGFKGPVYATPATRDLCALLLPDSGFLQEEEAKRLNKKAEKSALSRAANAGKATGKAGGKSTGKSGATAGGARGKQPAKSARGKKGNGPGVAFEATDLPAVTDASPPLGAAPADQRATGKPAGFRPIEPLYTEEEARAALSVIEVLDYDTPKELADGVVLRYAHASHILGAATVSLELGKGSKKRRLVFTGDLGRQDMPVLKNLVTLKQADYLISEGTYGDKLHEKRNRQKELADIINRAYERAKVPDAKFGHGLIVIPAFAVGRVQSVLYDLRILMKAGKIPVMPVFVDSPMAIKATHIYRHYTSLYNPVAAKMHAEDGDLFTTPKYAELLDYKQSLQLDEAATEPTIVVGSSGMASGGRIMRHLEKRLPGKQNTVVFCGFQGEGTLGRRLVTPETSEVMVGGKPTKVRATIEYLKDYSGHADYEDIIRWFSAFSRKPQKLFLVHGQAESLEAFKTRIEERLRWDVVVPKHREFIDLE